MHCQCKTRKSRRGTCRTKPQAWKIIDVENDGPKWKAVKMDKENDGPLLTLFVTYRTN